MKQITTLHTANELTQQLTSFSSFDEMIQTSIKNQYSPSLYGTSGDSKKTKEKKEQLADVFDFKMELMQSNIRVYRG